LKELYVQVETIVVGEFQVNCYVLYKEIGGPAVVIDPGGDPEDIIAFLSGARLRVTHIINTHGHGDHIAANGPLQELFPAAKICIHPRDAHMLTSAAANMSLLFGFNLTSPPADVMLEGNTEITLLGVKLAIEHIPGHSAGSICLIPDVRPHIAFVGDTLFAGSVGRTDFPGGNAGLLYAGIREKLFTLPEDTVVYCGHGVPTTIGQEKKFNPIVGEGA
jgi:hydroxyacylglutathione hydrolase